MRSNIEGKTIQSVHKNNGGYILKFTDGSVVNIRVTTFDGIPSIEFTPPLVDPYAATAKAINDKLSEEERQFLIKHINGTLSKEELNNAWII